MRIAHLDTGREWRGGQAQVLLLLRGLRERGHESVLLAPEAPLLERAREHGFETERWPTGSAWDLPAAIAALKALRRRPPDLVHGHTSRAHSTCVWLAPLLGRPLVVSRRFARGPGRGPFSRIKYRLAVSRYLCVSRAVFQAMERSGIAPRRLALVPSAFDPDPAHPPSGRNRPDLDLRRLIGAATQAVVVGTVASLTGEKNPLGLLAAAARVLDRIPDAHFVWIGDGPWRTELERARDRMGLGRQVHTLGFRSDARQLLAQFTLYVQPSWIEGLGTSILEAQAAGIPVIATAVGGVPELIEDGTNGRLVPPGNEVALSQAVADALEHPSHRARWVDRARVTVLAFDADSMVERTLEQYRAALEGVRRVGRSGGDPGRARSTNR